MGALGNVGFGAKYQQGRELQGLGWQEGGGWEGPQAWGAESGFYSSVISQEPGEQFSWIC